MTLSTLHTLFHPLIDLLGTICLIGLSAAGTLYIIGWILQKIWKLLLAMGVLALLVAVMGSML